MDIAALASIQKMSNVRGQAAIAVASQVKDMVEQNGANLVRMMESSVTPHVGGNIDVKL